MKSFLLAACAGALALAAPAAANSAACGEIDIFWVIDESGSVGVSNYETTKTSISASVDPFTLGPDNTRMSIIEFASTHPGEEYLWQSFTTDTDANKAAFKSHVEGLGFASGGTNLYPAVQYAYDYLSTTPGEIRPESHQFIVLLTDGYPNSNTGVEIIQTIVDDPDVTLLYVPIGSGANPTIWDGTLPDENVFASNDFSNLADTIATIVSEIECFVPGPTCLANDVWDLKNANLDSNTFGNAVSNPNEEIWRNAVELDSVVGGPPCCIRYVVDIFEAYKGNAFVGLTLELDFSLSGFLANKIDVYGADSKNRFFMDGAPTMSYNHEGTEELGTHVDKDRDQIELIYCPGDATISVTTYYQGIAKSFRTFNSVPAGEYKLVTSLKNDAGAGPSETTTVTISIAECINCDIVEICIPEWDCRTNGMTIYDSVNAGPASLRDGLEFTRRGWAELWRNGVSIEPVAYAGDVVEVVFTVDFLKSKADLMVGINPVCDPSKDKQAVTSPDSIMYWGSGWIYIGGVQAIRIDWRTFYPQTGDEIKAKIDLVAGTLVFELNDVSAGTGFQAMHTPINIPIRTYYAAASIFYVNAKVGLRCPDESVIGPR